jgi:hypothetical protein
MNRWKLIEKINTPLRGTPVLYRAAHLDSRSFDIQIHLLILIPTFGSGGSYYLAPQS